MCSVEYKVNSRSLRSTTITGKRYFGGTAGSRDHEFNLASPLKARASHGDIPWKVLASLQLEIRDGENVTVRCEAGVATWTFDPSMTGYRAEKANPMLNGAIQQMLYLWCEEGGGDEPLLYSACKCLFLSERAYIAPGDQLSRLAQQHMDTCSTRDEVIDGIAFTRDVVTYGAVDWDTLDTWKHRVKGTPFSNAEYQAKSEDNNGDECTHRGQGCSSGNWVYSRRSNKIETRHQSPHETSQYWAVSCEWSKFEGNDELLMEMLDRACENRSIEYFWLDKWCIDQKCATHKGEQLPTMGKVYSKAQGVMVLLPKTQEQVPEKYLQVDGRWMVQEYTKAVTKFWHQARSEGWFRRVWTWQEGQLAREGLYVTRTQVLPCRPVNNILSAPEVPPCAWVTHEEGWAIETNVYSLSAPVHSGAQHVAMQWLMSKDITAILRRYDAPSYRESLASQVEAVADRECIVDGDRIYGLLGLIPEGETLHWVKDRAAKDVLRDAAVAGLLRSDFLLSTSVDDGVGDCWLPKDLRDITCHKYNIRPDSTKKIRITHEGCVLEGHSYTGMVASAGSRQAVLILIGSSPRYIMLHGARIPYKLDVRAISVGRENVSDRLVYIITTQEKDGDTCHRIPGVVGIRSHRSGEIGRSAEHFTVGWTHEG